MATFTKRCFGFKHWWFVPESYNPKKIKTKKKKKEKSLFLACPAKARLISPDIVTNRPNSSDSLSISAFHPEERVLLERAADGWKLSLYKKKEPSIKNYGCCSLCNASPSVNDLTTQNQANSFFRKHYTTPIFLGGIKNKSNIILLCASCYDGILRTINIKDLKNISLLEEIGFLQGVSSYFLTNSNSSDLSDSLDSSD